MKIFLILSLIFTSISYADPPDAKEFMSAVKDCALQADSRQLNIRPEEYDGEPTISANITVTTTCSADVAKRLYDFLEKNQSEFLLNKDQERNFIAFGKRQQELEAFTEDGVTSVVSLGSGCRKKREVFTCDLISKMSLHHTLAPFLQTIAEGEK